MSNVGKKYLVAVSGGVDSVVLLDMLSQRPEYELVVAHFDHGIRPDSKRDAEFVQTLAAKYGFPFVSERAKLGRKASENLARTKRYEFLRRTAAQHQARIVTAHHQGDVVESIIFNLRRGSGWRGLAVMSATDIARPLIQMTKADLIAYAKKRGLEWREDPTNASDVYARNKIRHHVVPRIAHSEREEFVKFHAAQTALRQAIDEELAGLYKAVKSEGGYNRHFFIMADDIAATELLNYIIKQEKGSGLTRPALHRLLLAIKTGRPGSKHVAHSSVTLKLKPLTFTIV